MDREEYDENRADKDIDRDDCACSHPFFAQDNRMSANCASYCLQFIIETVWEKNRENGQRESEEGSNL